MGSSQPLPGAGPATVTRQGADWLTELLSRPTGVVGVSVERRDAAAKVRGQAAYAGDLVRPGMVHGKAVRSPHPRARILSIDASAALDIPGVVAVFTAGDLPGDKLVGPRAVKDMAVLADGVVSFVGEAVALVVAESRQIAEEAAELVLVEYEVLPPVWDAAAALAPGSPQLRPGGNLCHEQRILRGDFAAQLAAADLVVTNTYRTQTVDHGYIEPDSVLGEPGEHGIILYVGSKSPHNDRGEVASVLGLRPEQVRIVVVAVGGSFGGKPDIPMVCMVGLMVLKTGRPARMELTREECLLAKAKRHPYEMVYTHAVRANGEILGVKAEILADAGAYTGYTPTVVGKGIIHAAGPYRAEALDLHARAAFTNNPSGGAMRGYGVPQVVFAVERQLDIIGRRLGLDPFTVRERNLFRDGDLTATGQTVTGVHLQELVDMARARAAVLPLAEPEAPHIRRAWGFAAFFYGAGRTGVADTARVRIALRPDGFLHAFVGTPDTGQGSDTALAQIAAGELGLPFDLVQLTSADTDLTYDCGTSTASRVTYVVGNAIKTAAGELKLRLLGALSAQGGRPASALPADRDALARLASFCQAQGMPAEADGYFETTTIKMDANGQGAPYGAYTYGVQLTGMKVNLLTGQSDVERIVCAYDAGTVVNPRLMEGQIQGGTVIAQGFALTEDLGLVQAVAGNRNLDTYLMPTVADVPPMDVSYMDVLEPSGPFGAKGLGEPTTLPGAASIANAISAATGVEFYELPITPERVVRAVAQPEG